MSDIHEVVDRGKADAVCLASVLHYNYLRSYDAKDEFSEEGNVEYLKSGRGFSNIQDATLPAIKDYLSQQLVPCRPVERAVHA